MWLRNLDIRQTITCKVTYWLAWTSPTTPVALFGRFVDLAMGCVVLKVDNIQIAGCWELSVAVQLARLVIDLAALVAFKNLVNSAMSTMVIWPIILVDAIIIASQEVSMALLIPAALEIVTAFGVTVTKIRLARVPGLATI